MFRFDDRSIWRRGCRMLGTEPGMSESPSTDMATRTSKGAGKVTLADRQYVPPGWTDWQALLDLSTYNVYNYQINDNGRIVAHGTSAADYQTDVFARRAVRFIQDRGRPENDAAPFFLTVMPLAPHIEAFPWTAFQSPWQWDIRPAPPATRARFPCRCRSRCPSTRETSPTNLTGFSIRPPMTGSDISGITRQYRHRLESLRAVDDLVGTVAALDAAGELDNTVILFTSDNGFLHGEHRMPQKLVASRSGFAFRCSCGFRRVAGHGFARGVEQQSGADDSGTGGRVAEAAGRRDLVPALTAAGYRQSLAETVSCGTLAGRHQPDARCSDICGGPHQRQPKPFGTAGCVVCAVQNPTNTPEFYDFTPSIESQVWSLHATTSSALLQIQQSLKASIAGLAVCQDHTCRELEFLDAPAAPTGMSLRLLNRVSIHLG